MKKWTAITLTLLTLTACTTNVFSPSNERSATSTMDKPKINKVVDPLEKIKGPDNVKSEKAVNALKHATRRAPRK